MNLSPFTKKVLENTGARVVIKEGFFWTLLHYVVLIITFGGNKSFKTGFVTTIGPIIGVPKSWEGSPPHTSKDITIAHELVHVEQFKKCGLGNAWLGIPIMLVLYIGLPLPIGFAWTRWMLERRAYLANVLLTKQHYGKLAAEVESRRAVKTLFSGNYGWTLFSFMRDYATNWFLKQI